MKRLKIQVFNEKHDPVHTIICEHLDVCNSSTIIGRTYRPGEDPSNYYFTEKVDHFSLMDGMITVYYESGYEMEITRIND